MRKEEEKVLKDSVILSFLSAAPNEGLAAEEANRSWSLFPCIKSNERADTAVLFYALL